MSTVRNGGGGGDIVLVVVNIKLEVVLEYVLQLIGATKSSRESSPGTPRYDSQSNPSL